GIAAPPRPSLALMFVHSFTLPLLLLSLPRYTLPNAMKLRPILLSALLLIPVFWHHHIEAGDLGSHVYNAWLAQLVQKGTAPGVYAVWQWNNVLFDLLLLLRSPLLLEHLRPHGRRHAPLSLAPHAIHRHAHLRLRLHMGFMNYYL